MHSNGHTIGSKKGFTLLELLIVIAIIAILAVIIIIVLDPAETLKKSRDAQRMSDLASLKNSIGVYTVTTSSPQMAGTSNTGCKGSTSSDAAYAAGDKVYYSLPSSSAITDATLDGGSASVPAPVQASTANYRLTNGNGWLPINMDSLISGSPISNLPSDPINTVAVLSGVVSTDFVYRYVCSEQTGRYEIDAQMESASFASGSNDVRANDGGNNNAYYEVGTNLQLLGTGTDF
jgi:prepilin-type N-terminal cleavage/methylation domain-containing protein